MKTLLFIHALFIVGTLGIIKMTFRDLSILIFLGIPIEKNYIISIKENKFKDSIKSKISNKNRNKLVSSNSSGPHGQFSGLFGRKLNLTSSRELGIRGKYGQSLNSSLKIKAKIIPVDSESIVLNTKYQSLGRYLIWIGTPFFIIIITLMQVASNFYSLNEFNYYGLFSIISIILTIALIGSLTTMWTARNSIIQFEKFIFEGMPYVIQKKETMPNKSYKS